MVFIGAGAGGYSGGGGRPGAGSDIPILRYENNNNIDTYNYLYETGNGINAQEEGDARGDGTQAQGTKFCSEWEIFCSRSETKTKQPKPNKQTVN